MQFNSSNGILLGFEGRKLLLGHVSAFTILKIEYKIFLVAVFKMKSRTENFVVYPLNYSEDFSMWGIDRHTTPEIFP